MQGNELIPDREIALRVKEKLKSSSLLSDTAIDKIESGLIQGNLSPEDWVFIIENERQQVE